MHDLAWADWLARVFLVLMFPFSAIDKVIHWDDAMKQATSSIALNGNISTIDEVACFIASSQWMTLSILPGAPVLLVAAMVLEVVAPVCIVADWHARPAALALAVFCVATALLYHPFWKAGDFWAQGGSVDRDHFWDFTKNFGLAGGLMLVALGAALAPLTA